MKARFYIDPESGEPHVGRHGVSEREVAGHEDTQPAHVVVAAVPQFSLPLELRVGVDPANPSNTVSSRFIGRVVPGSGNRFNGAFQAGQGINDELQD